MRMGMVAILVAASLAACRRDEYLKEREEREPQVVALNVRTEPQGATVRVNRMERVWTTPCDIADFSIQRGMQEVEVSLENYETVNTRVYYDGQSPASLKLRLRSTAAAKTPPPAPEEARPVKPDAGAPPAAKAPEERPKPAEEAKPAPVKIEQTAGGTRLKFASPTMKTRIQAKTVVSDPEKPGEIFLPDVPPEKVVVELVDPKTDAVIATVEFAPAPGAVARPPLPPKDPVVADVDRVGEVRLVSKTYGVFVRLDPGLQLQPGEEILVFREGREVARTKILKITKGDDKYPDGAAQVQKEGSIQKGDEVRRTKP